MRKRPGILSLDPPGLRRDRDGNGRNYVILVKGNPRAERREIRILAKGVDWVGIRTGTEFPGRDPGYRGETRAKIRQVKRQ